MTGEADRTLVVASEVAALLAARGAKCAVIGAVALAVRGYPRGTEDLDLATITDVFTVLRETTRELLSRGYEAALVLPDADDALGGVLSVAAPGAELVQVVNYLNPWRGWPLVGKEAIETAEPNVLGGLAVVDVPHLVALKLYAGGNKSRLDVLELLDRNRDSLREVEEVCERLGLASQLAHCLGGS